MDSLEQTKAARGRLQPRFTRMDEDLGLYLLEKFAWQDTDNRDVPNVESVTTNFPRTFADKVVSSLGTADRRFDIAAERTEDATLAEDFVKFGLAQAEVNLLKQLIFPLEESFDFGTSLRGTIACRVILKRDGSKYYFDIAPIDARALVYEPGPNGCALASIEGKKTAAEIERDYGETLGKSLFKQKKEAEVKDIWTPTHNVVYIDNKPVRTIEHNLGMNPILVVTCPTAPHLAGRQDAVKHEAESIYAPVRDLYGVLNKAASAWHTQNMMAILPPLQFISKEGRKASTPPFGVAATVNIKFGEEFKRMPISDVTLSHQAFFGQLAAWIQRGTMANIDYGELSFELSALAIKRLESAKDQVFVPRLKAKKSMAMLIADALIFQFIMGGYHTDLGDLGEEIPFKPGDFKNKRFMIQVDYFTINPDENVADMTIATTAKSIGLPEEYIFKRILHIEDYEGVIRMRDRERIGNESQTVRFYRYGKSLLETGEEDDKLEAELVLKEIGMTMEQVAGATAKPGLKQPASQPKPHMSLGVPPVGTPRKSEEEIVGREEQRREGITRTEEGRRSKEME